MNLNTLKLSLDGSILIIEVNREKRLNVITLKAMEELDDVFDKVYDDDDIKGVIITGAGEKAFVAGADVTEFDQLNEVNGRKFSERGQEIFAKIENCPKPVIAAVNGYALGGGAELALACHIRIASDNAIFGLPEVTLGILPGYGGTQRLPLIVGRGKALELIMTGDKIDAAEGYRLGLYNQLVPLPDLMDICKSMLNRIFDNAPVATSLVIDCVNASQSSHSQEAGYEAEANAFWNCCKTQDFREGTKAFIEKRKPKYKGV